ncbi:hypothetical protein Btru_041417 [Bulinus truncatus]|nr:hypothetical protein Btru_041417 [Bulinus truncatus]
MAAYNEFGKLRVLFLLLILLISNINYAAKIESISNKRLCADKECTVVISRGKALTSHLTSQPFFLSFRKDEIILIKSKSAGNNPRLWGGEVNGKRGYFDRNFVREMTVFVKEPQYLVNTEAKRNDVPGRPPHLEKITREKEEKINGEEAQATVKVQMPNTENNIESANEDDLVKTGSNVEAENPVNSGIKEHNQGQGSSHMDEKNPDIENVENETISQMTDSIENEEFWDDLDNDYFETERDRFDTSALNQFVKQRLNVDAETNQKDEKELKNVDADFHVSPLQASVEEASNESPVDESAKPLLYKPSPGDNKSTDILSDEDKLTEESDSDASVNDDQISLNKSEDVDNSAEESAGDTSFDESPGKVDVKAPGDDESTVGLPEISSEPHNSKTVSQDTLDDKLVRGEESVENAAGDEHQKTDSADTLPRPEVSENKETERSPVEETKTGDDTLPRPEVNENKETESSPVEETKTGDDTEKLGVVNVNGDGEKKSGIDQMAQPSKEDYKDPNMFPIEDEEEIEIGADIPLYDPSSMSSKEGSQKVEAPKNEAQTVKIPSADYTSPEKEPDEQRATEPEETTKESVDTAGPVENLPLKFTDDEDNKDRLSVAATDVIIESAAVVEDKRHVEISLDGVDKQPGVKDLASETHKKVSEDKEEKNHSIESMATADSVQMEKFGEKEKSTHENVTEKVNTSVVNNISASVVNYVTPEVKPETPPGSIDNTASVVNNVTASVIDDVTPEVKPDAPSGSIVNTATIVNNVTPEVKPETPSVSIGNITTSQTGPETPSESSVNKITSEVRPDTPSGDSPEQGQVDDPVSAEMTGQGSGTNAETDEKNAEHNDVALDGSEKEKSTNPVDLDHFQRDEKDVIPGGFAAFLQPSISEPRQLDNPSSTPDLDSAGVVLESISSTVTAAADVNYSKGHGDKLDTAERQVISPDVTDKIKRETLVEGGSTLVFDAEGNFISVVLEEDSASLSVLEHTSTADKLSATPTNIEEATVSLAAKDGKGHVDVPLKSSAFSEVSNSTVLVSSDVHLLDTHISDVYKSSDFSSRKVLSVNNHPHDHAPEHDHHHQHDQDHHHHDHDHFHHHHDSDHHHKHEDVLLKATPTLDPSPTSELVKTQSEEQAIQANSQGEHRKDEQVIAGNEQSLGRQLSAEELIKDKGSQNKAETSTQPPEDLEIPAPPVFTGGDDSVPAEFDSGNTYHSRKMNIDELTEEEGVKQPTVGLAKSVVLFIEVPAKFVIERLPPSLQSLLEQEPVGLSPVMTVLVALFSILVLLTGCITSACSSGGKKQKLRATIDVITELEAKLQLAIKEKENIEDSLKDFKSENTKLKDEMSKQKRDSGKNQTEIQTIQLHNETLKKQLQELEEEIQAVKENANVKQGEVKQTNKKTKEMEKIIKKFEEREKKIDQENQKLTSELRHKDEELVSLKSKVNGLNEQVGHLQTSKDQLLSEAEDWKEKVSDLKERLEQREEEFKQMQENIMFKENELEVLKDCFLQLKSFEEEENEVEDGAEDASQRVQEKLRAMMDVSKVNASLLAVEEERNMLANRLQIENEARKELEEQLESSRRSVESSMADKMKAERQCQEAQTKLNVLSSYFKEKEMQLQRELGEHEALKKQNLNKLVSADETTRSMQQEVEIFRTQAESLKRELASSERDFRSQIAANEKKAHENWLAARAAERELKEARHEAGVLRQKLTDIERRQLMGPGGLIRPLPTRGLPPPGMLNGPPPPPGSMDRSPSRGSMPPLPPPHLRDEEFLRRGPPLGIRPPPPDARSPPLPPFGDARSPPPRMPPPGMMDGRSPPPYDRRPLPPHMMDRRSPPFRLPPPDMLPHPMRGGPLPPFPRGGGSPSSGTDSPHLDRADGRYPPPYARNPMFPPDRPSPRGPAPRQQQSQVPVSDVTKLAVTFSHIHTGCQSVTSLPRIIDTIRSLKSVENKLFFYGNAQEGHVVLSNRNFHLRSIMVRN